MRSKRARKRPVEVDPVYRSKLITRVINKVMLGGKKSTAERIVYGVLGKLHEDPKEATKLFEEAIRNVMPQQEVRSRRVGGATYQVPMPVKHDRSEALAIRWIVDIARAKSGKAMSEILFEVLRDAQEGTGDAIRKRDDTHRMADSNRAFAHFARY